MPPALFLDTGGPPHAIDLWPIVLPVVLGLVAVYWLLPRARPFPAVWGATAGGLALLVGGWLLTRLGSVTPETLLFYVFSALALLAGGLLVTQRNPARAALSFAVVVLSTCGLFLLLAGPFLMAATIIIYAGAIVVTFLFVIMLAQQEGRSDADQRSREPLLSCLAGFVLLGALLFLLQMSYAGTKELHDLESITNRTGAVQARIWDLMDKQVRQEKLTREELQSVFEQSEGLLGEYELWSRDLVQDRPTVRQRTHHTADEVEQVGDVAVDARQTVVGLERRLPETTNLDLNSLQEKLIEVKAAGRRFLTTSSFLQPRPRDTLSEFSGPAPNRVDPGTPRNPGIPRNDAGVPQQPAENVAYLGRALFTDYLIAVELGGTLLLVATIGAIAIVSRHAESAS